MQLPSATGVDAIFRAEPPPSTGPRSRLGRDANAERWVLLAIVQRLTLDVSTESLISEVVWLLQTRLGLEDVTISLSPPSPPSHPPTPSSPSVTFSTSAALFSLASSPSASRVFSSFSMSSGERRMANAVEVPVLWGHQAIGMVCCRVALPGDPADLANVEQYLTLVAALLTCHARMLQASRNDAISSDSAKLHDKTWAMERSMIAQALKQTKGNMAAAARHLGITPRIIRYKVRKLGIDPRQVG